MRPFGNHDGAFSGTVCNGHGQLVKADGPPHLAEQAPVPPPLRPVVPEPSRSMLLKNRLC